MKEKATILVVDDEKNTREGLARALRNNYKVLLAEHGQQALDILSQQPVDVVLSDIRMPGMDGMTLMQRTLARTPSLYGSPNQSRHWDRSTRCLTHWTAWCHHSTRACPMTPCPCRPTLYPGWW